MGLDDQYFEPDRTRRSRGVTTPKPEWKGDIMAEHDGSVSQKTIDELVNKNKRKLKCPCDK